MAALVGAVTMAAGCSSADTSSSTDVASASTSAVVASPVTTVSSLTSTVASAPTTSQPRTTPSATAPPDDFASSPLVLVVQRFDPDDASNVSYVVVAQDGRDLATLSPPADFDGQLAIRAIHQAPGATLALVEIGDRLATLDAETLQLETYLIGADVEWHDPEARFLIVSIDQHFEVIDVKTLTRHDIGSFERFLSAVPAGDRLVVTTIENDELVTVIVDVAADSVDVLDSLTGSGWSYDDSGAQLLARNSPTLTNRNASEFLVSPASEPTTQTAWFTSDRAPRAVWGDDSLVVAEASGGRVFVVTAESAVDIGVLPGDRLGSMFGDPTSAGVLIEHGVDALPSWYHIDPVSATLTELPELGGLSLSATVASRPGLVVLDDAVSSSDREAGRVVAVRVRDGSVTELVSTPDRSIVSGGALSDELVVVGLGDDQPLQIFDLESGETISLDGAVFARPSPDAALAAIELGSARSRTVSLLDLSTGALRELTEGHVIAWLQR